MSDELRDLEKKQTEAVGKALGPNPFTMSMQDLDMVMQVDRDKTPPSQQTGKVPTVAIC